MSRAVVLEINPLIELTDELFTKLCQANPDLRLERDAHWRLMVMTPAGSESSHRNAELTFQLGFWSRLQKSLGIAFDSSGGFILPNGAIRSPDASWILRSRWDSLNQDQKRGFAPLCPDFVVELRSPSDSLSDLQAKLEEYLANGSRLGWLLDPSTQTVYVYRPALSVEALINPKTLSADPELPGFILDLTAIWGGATEISDPSA